MHKETVSIVVPAYNERPVINRLVQDTLTVISGYTKHFEVLVIDDGSVDRTFEEVCKIKNKSLKVIRNPRNIGKTKTILNGFAIAKGSIVCFIDADYQYDPRDLPKLIETVKRGADLCVGYRKHRQDTFYRRFMSWGFNRFNRLLFSIISKDVNCGLKAFRTESFKAIKLHYLSAKWFIDTEILARYRHNNYKVEEVPVRHYKRSDGASKVSCIKLALETFIYGIMLKLDLMFNLE